jgi:hypothetical protein
MKKRNGIYSIHAIYQVEKAQYYRFSEIAVLALS